MTTTKTKLARNIALAALLGVALPGTATAASYDPAPTRYRVVEVPGNDQLHLRARPRPGARVVGLLAFDARGLTFTGERRGEWLRVRGIDDDGEAQVGWANGTYLAVDKRREGTEYSLVDDDNSDPVTVHARPTEQSRTRGHLRADTTGIKANGDCDDGWCAIVVRRGWRVISGYVRQDYLKVARPFTPYLAREEGDEDTHAPTPGDGSADEVDAEPDRPHRPWWKWRQWPNHYGSDL